VEEEVKRMDGAGFFFEWPPPPKTLLPRVKWGIFPFFFSVFSSPFFHLRGRLPGQSKTLRQDDRPSPFFFFFSLPPRSLSVHRGLKKEIDIRYLILPPPFSLFSGPEIRNSLLMPLLLFFFPFFFFFRSSFLGRKQTRAPLPPLFPPPFSFFFFEEQGVTKQFTGARVPFPPKQSGGIAFPLSSGLSWRIGLKR